jgi:hypothetical protein
MYVYPAVREILRSANKFHNRICVMNFLHPYLKLLCVHFVSWA